MKENVASSTAYTVLQGLLYTAGKEKYKSFIDEETKEVAKRILSSTKEGQRRLKQLANPASLFLLKIMERVMLPGISVHYALRKHFIEKQVLERIEKGVTQVVNVGAGFDTLAWRLHSRYPAVRFIEIDHPATSRAKRDALTSVKQFSQNFHLIAVDLAEQELVDVLSSFDAFERSLETVFICEGVLMYLDTSLVNGVFESLKKLTDKNSHFIFTAAAPVNSKENNTGWLLKLYLKLNKEPLKWCIQKDEVSGFLKRQGYDLEELADGPEMNLRFLDSPVNNPHRGEFAVACRVSL